MGCSIINYLFWATPMTMETSNCHQLSLHVDLMTSKKDGSESEFMMMKNQAQFGGVTTTLDGSSSPLLNLTNGWCLLGPKPEHCFGHLYGWPSHEPALATKIHRFSWHIPVIRVICRTQFWSNHHSKAPFSFSGEQ